MMKKRAFNLLKFLRVVVALCIFLPISLFFVDFLDLLPDSTHRLLQMQLMPAVFSGAVVTLLVLFLLTLVFGRLYCSVVCPAGVLQDVFNRLSCIGKKKRDGTVRFHYRKPMNILRYGILAATVVLALSGITELCLALDPYSNFGRIAANLFRLFFVWFNNHLALMLSSMGNYSFYPVTMRISPAALLAAAMVFVMFAMMVYFRGRLFCNTLCPVGALLSLVSRYSLFRINFDEEKCVGCKACEHACKAEAVDAKNMQVDGSRCVVCFNCTSQCKKDALHYALSPIGINGRKRKEMLQKEVISESRRGFIATGAALVGTVPVRVLAQGGKPVATPVTPPGSLTLERFKDLCTGCHLCVVQCPTHVLQPAKLEYGFSYLLKPHMSYEDSFCNYNCHVCSEVCPTDAIRPISVEEKKRTQVGVAHFHIGRCIVNTEENDCGACSEHCPTQAVHMVSYKGTLTIPKVEPEMCIGCGGCESICPVRPERAIVIVANGIHRQVEPPKLEEEEKIDVDDFGF